MNYLIAVDFCFADAPGGSARVAWDIAKAARDCGWKVGMLCLNPRPGALPQGPTDVEGIQVARYTKPVLPAWHPLRMERQIGAAADAFRRHFGATRWDLVHIHSPLTGAGVMQGAGRTPAYVYTVHSPVVREQEIVWRGRGAVGALKLLFGLQKLKALERRLLRRSAAVHVLSEFTRSEILACHRLLRPARVIPHWAREEFRIAASRQEARQALGWPVDQLTFFTVRQHGLRYGLDVAIRSFADLRERPGWMFYVAGDGPMKATLEALTHELQLTERVRFTGILTDEQLALAYRASDVFVLPTRALECFGLIILEAFASGCPVIATDAGAIPEIMHDILPEFIVPAGNAAALREKLRAVIEGTVSFPSSQTLMGFAERRYGRRVIVPRLMDLLTSAALPGAPPNAPSKP